MHVVQALRSRARIRRQRGDPGVKGPEVTCKNEARVRRQFSRLRDAEKDLCFALGKLQAGNRVSAYLNAMVAMIHIGQEMTETEHQTALVAVARLQLKETS